MAGITYPAYTNQNLPAWAGDFLSREHLLPGGARIDPAQFNGRDAVVVVVGVAGASAAATSVPVAALSGPIPNGTVLSFGTNKFARLTAAAATGATALTVAAIPTALVSTDTATYPGVLPKSVASGVVVGRTYAERNAGTAFGPAADTDDEVYIVAFSIDDLTKVQNVDLVRPSAMVIKENLLPGTLSATVLGKVRANYVCVFGKAT